MQRFFCFILSFVFFIQTNVWATGSASPHSVEMMQKMVDRYNSMSHEQKIADIRQNFSTAPEADKKFVEKVLKEMSQTEFLKMKVKNGKMVANYEGQEVTFVPKSQYKMSINGKDIEWKPGQMEQTFKQIDKLLTAQNASIMDFFISPAYAIAPIFLIYGMALGAASAFTATFGLFQYLSQDRKQLKKMCELSSTDADVKKQVAEDRKFLAEYDGCSDAEHLETYQKCSSLSEDKRKKLGECNDDDMIDYKLCREAKSCLDQLEADLDARAASTNNSDRGDIKDVAPAQPSKQQAAPSASQQ